MANSFVEQEVLGILLRDTPVAFWKLLRQRMEWAYGDAFASVSNDPRILANQRSAKLLDERFYLAERALHDAAINGGAVSSDQKIPINSWVYTFVRSQSVCMVQSYVPTPSDFARPADFREQHAALNTFLSRPQFAFGDVSPTLFDIAQVAGIVIHGPFRRAFEEGAQKLAFLRFCVPSQDYKRWEINLAVEDIVAAFNATATPTVPQRDIAKPKPKPRDADKDDEGSA